MKYTNDNSNSSHYKTSLCRVIRNGNYLGESHGYYYDTEDYADDYYDYNKNIDKSKR